MKFSALVERFMACAMVCAAMLVAGCRTTQRVPVAEPTAEESPQSTATQQSTTPMQKSDYERMQEEVERLVLPSDSIARLIKEAASWIGTPYRYGGQDRKGTDCSGMVVEVFKKAFNEKLPRTSRDQQTACHSVDSVAMQPGDLLFYATGRDKGRISHVGLYIGNGEMIHASSSRGVIVSNIAERYYAMRFRSVGRPESIRRIYGDSVVVAADTIRFTVPADEDLDEAVAEQVDSIFSGFFD